MEAELYKERQPMPFRYVIAGIAMAVMLFGAWQTRLENPVSSLLMVFFAAAFGVVLWGFTEFSVVVTPTEVRFGFPLFRKHFALSEIQVGETQRIALLAGIGIHYWQGKWVYNSRYGEGVNISRGRRSYLLGSRHPLELQNALMQGAPQRMVKP
jgi:hypothetical protein